MAALGVTVDFTANIANFSNQINRLSGNLDQFQRHAETMSSRISKSFSALGVGLSVAGLVSFVKSGIDVLDNLNDISTQTGISVEKLSGLSLVAKQSGTDLETMALAINKSSVNIAKNGEAFKQLGVDTKDPFIALTQLSDVFNSIEDPMQRAAFAQKAFGKSWADLAPTLALGGAEIRRLAAEGEKLSGATQELASQADKFNDTLELLKARLSIVAVVAGGSFASAFNNLVDSISNATEAGVTFNNVMAGLGNAFAHKESFSGVAGQLDRVNRQIGITEKKVNALQHNGVIGGLLDDLAGNDVNLEKNRLDGLYKAQEKLANQLKAETSAPPLALQNKAPDSAALKKFIGAGGGGGGGGASSGKGHSSAKTAVDQLQQSYQAMLASLQKEISLRDKNSETAKLSYEIISGGLKGLAPAQAANLLALTKEQDALDRQDKKWAALVESANEYYDLQKSNADLIKGGGIQDGFNEALAKTQDQLSAGNITADQAKAEFDKLGQAWNNEYIKPAMEGQDKLSEFAIQSARNMETAFADFLFDPFSQSVGGMADNFLTAIRRMGANYLSSELFDLIKNGITGASSTKSSTGTASSFGSLLGSLFSSSSSSSSAGIAASDAAFLASAKGNVFDRGNVIPFAKGGGIINQPVTFPVAGGKTGLMGEAGPEAIMPLARGADGKLGVAMQSGGGSSRTSNAPANQRGAIYLTQYIQGGTPAPDVRRSAGQGAREALGLINSAGRYG
jgi:lambda family phage tail tape measure protein